MPHCVIEYSKGLSEREEPVTASALNAAVLEGTLNSGLFEAKDVKCRAQRYDDYCAGVGEGEFVHVTAYLLSGRTPDQKKALSASIFECLKPVVLSGCSLTVDVRDIDREIYSKARL